MFDLIFYKTESGREPAKEFLDSLDDKTVAEEETNKTVEAFINLVADLKIDKLNIKLA